MTCAPDGEHASSAPWRLREHETDELPFHAGGGASCRARDLFESASDDRHRTL